MIDTVRCLPRLKRVTAKNEGKTQRNKGQEKMAIKCPDPCPRERGGGERERDRERGEGERKSHDKPRGRNAAGGEPNPDRL